MNRWKYIVLVITLFSGVLKPALGLEVSRIHSFGGLYWQGNGDPEGAPSPLKPVWGLELPIEITPLISIQPALSFPSPFDYTLTSAGLAVPTEIETADAVAVFQLLIDPKLAFSFRPAETILVAPFFSPTFIIFVPTFGYGRGKAGYLDPSSGEADTFRADLVKSLYSSFRMFRPSIGTNIEWRFSEVFGFFGSLAAHFPLFHIWDGLSLPFYDGFIITLKVGFTVHFPSK